LLVRLVDTIRWTGVTLSISGNVRIFLDHSKLTY